MMLKCTLFVLWFQAGRWKICFFFFFFFFFFSSFFLLVLLLLLLLFAVVCGVVGRGRGAAAKKQSSVFLSIKGEKQGQIGGEASQKGKENLWQVLSYSQDVKPGKSDKTLFVVVREGSASPLLLAATSNAELLDVQLSLWQRQRSGAERVFMTLHLTNAKISDLKSTFDANGSFDDVWCFFLSLSFFLFLSFFLSFSSFLCIRTRKTFVFKFATKVAKCIC
jgi:type VI protein secretion system component Hcp